MAGLSVDDIIPVSIVLSPLAAQYRNFGIHLIIGSSPIIDTTERIRTYTSLAGVGADFPSTSPEYLASVGHFSQTPQPLILKIGRWAQSATNGVLHGAYLGATQQRAALSGLAAVSNGQLQVTIDGNQQVISGLNFTSAVTLNGVASILDSALTTFADVTWNGSRFDIISKSAGISSSVGYALSQGGTDIATLLGLTQASGASVPVAGVGAESAVDGFNALVGTTTGWYAASWAPLVPLSDISAMQIAAIAEGSSPARVVGFTTQNPLSVDPTSSLDLASQVKLAGYRRTVVQFSTSNPYAMASFFGRALTVNFDAPASVITMMFKQEIGVVAETLTESQAATLTAKRCNYFVNYENGTAIVQNGVTGSAWWDEVHDIDWLTNKCQTDLFNVFYVNPTKIPQTDDGVHTLLTQLEASLAAAAFNGMLAPGVWNAEGFGQLGRGDYLPKGYYVYAQSVDLQAQADRDARKSPPLIAAIKLAGAIHSANVVLNVNR